MVYGVAIGLAVFLSSARLVGWRERGPIIHRVIAVGMIELTTLIFALALIGIVAAFSRGGARALLALRPPKDDESKEKLVTRREAIERTLGVAVVGASTTALGWGILRGRHAFEIEELVVKIPNWPRSLEGYTIAQVSDIHVGAFVRERELEEGFELVRRVKPDLMVLTGDLVDFESEKIDVLLEALARLKPRDGIHAIFGNHDHYAGVEELAESMRAVPDVVRLLSNESIHVRREDGGGFVLAGVDDLEGRRRNTPEFPGPDLGRALAGAPPDVPRILLAHQPKYFHESQGRVALQLSGHTHGGQINPGFRPAAAIMEFVAGRYERAGSTLWVNRGFGVVGPPARIGAPPEVTKIVLVSG